MPEPIAWRPSPEQMEQSRLRAFIRKHHLKNYEQLFRKSVENVEWFWEAFAADLELEWDEPYRKVLDVSGGWRHARWFGGGKLNWAHNAVDGHARGENANRPAVIWEGEDKTSRTLSYRELSAEVSRLAGALKSLGVKKGDRAGIFMPMIPECVIALLACSKIGAVFIPLFSGYAAPAVAARLNDCQAKVLFTCSAFRRRGNLIPMKQTADEALSSCHSVKHCIVYNKPDVPVSRDAPRDIRWQDLVRNAPPRCGHEPTDAEDPSMIIYTSGTSGKPKGAVHTHCGFPLKAAMDLAYHFDLKPSDRLFWFTDMGWMMGPWEVAGALLWGSSLLIYDGTPDYPQPDRLWELIAKHRVSILGLSPTVIRALMRHPVNSTVKRHNLSGLRVLGSTGEPWNPEAWFWYFENVGGRRCPVINYSGGTEIGGGILACSFLQPLKPCSFAGPALGMDADVVNEKGEPVRGEVGELVIRKPWIGMTRGFWNDPERYESAYWSRFPDTWVHGDWARVDSDGFWFVEGRSDDTIKTAGKRIGPAEVEAAMAGHPAVLESAAIGVPDDLKGGVAVGFVVLKPGYPESENLRSEIKKHAQSVLGKAVAPEKILFVGEIPKTRNAKIMRRLIRAKHLRLDNLGDLSGLENPSALDAVANAR